MKVLQSSPFHAREAVQQARDLDCARVAWTLEGPLSEAASLAAEASLESEGWLQVARDPCAAAEHPEWMHAPQHHEWLARYPDSTVRHPALVAPYIGLNTRPAFEHAVRAAEARITAAVSDAGISRVWLGDIQGPPMGCGCGNPSCRSWDNAPGDKLAVSTYDRPEVLFPLEVFRELRSRVPTVTLIPVLCPECERFVKLEKAEDPDGPDGTNLCRGVPCVPCTAEFWPRLLAAFRELTTPVGLLLMVTAQEKDHPIYGGPRAWASVAQRYYGRDLIPCIEPEEAAVFQEALILTDAPQHCWPVAPPAGYVPTIPAIQCGYCPPE